MKVRVHVRGWEGDKVSMFEFSDGIEAIYAEEGTLTLVRDLGGANELVGRFAAGSWLYYEHIKAESS